MRHYVFGYGSLICSESRATTAAALGGSDTSGIPVRLANWVRLWNVRGPNTYLGVQSVDDSKCSCVGVLFPIPSSSDDHDEVLEALDRREGGYNRERVNLELIERVDDLLESKDVDGYYKDTFLQDTKSNKGVTASKVNDVCVWIYVPKPKYANLASTEVTILQSYVDICLKGCLSISKDFTAEFVKGTYGWYPGDSRRCEGISTDDQDETWEDPTSSCWIDDRMHPLYIRADKEYALENIEVLDASFDASVLDRRREITMNQCFYGHFRIALFRAYIFFKRKCA